MSVPTSPDPLFRLRLFGTPELTDAAGRTPTGLGPGKALALVCYLALEGSARREELAELLWGDAGDARARNALRQTLHRLRTALGPDVLPPDQDPIRLGPGLWVDAKAFESLLEADRVADALDLYEGELLHAFTVGEISFEHWADAERTRFRTRYREAVDLGVAQALDSGANDRALRWTERLSDVAPLDAEAALLHATVLTAAGRRSEAAGALRAFGVRYEAELQQPPPKPVRDALSGLDSVRASGEADPVGRAAGEPRPLLGREPEMTLLLSIWRRVREGAGAAVVVEGDAGAGKTRLLREFVSNANALDGALVLWGSESAAGGPVPYAPLAEALRGAVRAPGLAGASDHLLAEAARLIPELRDRFDLPPAGPIEDQASRLRFFEGVAALLEAVAYEQPVCLVLDDLDRSGDATRDLARYLLTRLRGAAVMLVYTGPTGSLSRLAEDGAERLRLRPLPEQALAQLIDMLPGELDAVQRDRLAGLAQGNARRAEELARRALQGAPLGDPLVPLRTILGERIAELPARERRLLLGAALIGRPVPLRLLAAASHTSEPAAFDALHALIRAGLLAQSDAGVAPDSELAAELAREHAGAAGRALIAGWAADALASDSAASDAELARLYGLAGRAAETFHHAMAAADEAVRTGAWKEAAALLRHAAEHAPDARARAGAEQRLASLGGIPLRLAAGEHGSAASAGRTGRRAADDVGGREAMDRRPRRRSALRKGVAAVAAGTAAVLLIAAVTLGYRDGGATGGHVLSDTLYVVELLDPGHAERLAVTGPLADAPVSLRATDMDRPGPVWIDSLSLPWMNPRPSPSGHLVALERMTAQGPEAYVITADRRDTLRLASGGDNLVLGWSPDGAWVLIARGAVDDGRYDSDLFAFPVAAGEERVAIDTASASGIEEAVWSPDGSRIAWTAVTPSRGLEVFVARADGGAPVSVSTHPSDDYHPAWAADGSRVAFTSERDGNAEIYARDLPAGDLWRITFNDARDDRASFSGDGRVIAFESDRGGVRSVFAISAYGGEPYPVAPPGRRVALAGWSGRRPHLAALRLRTPAPLPVGSTTFIEAEAVYSDGSVAPLRRARWLVLDPEVAEVSVSGGTHRLVGRRPGTTRLVVEVGGWRADTVDVMVGTGPLVLLEEDFERGAARWQTLGDGAAGRREGIGRDGSAALGGAMENSGLLSRAGFPLSHGLQAEAWFHAPAVGPREPRGQTVLALVAPPADRATDARQLLPLASITWMGEAGRVAYRVHREVWTEPVAELRSGDAHLVRLSLEEDGRVGFYVDGRLRWRSSESLAGASASRARLWLRAAGPGAALDDVRVVAGR